MYHFAVTENDKTNAQTEPAIPAPAALKLETSSIVVSPFSQDTELDEKPTTIALSQISPLPQTDTSWAAWRVLCGAILVQGMLFAFPLTFGVFQDYFGRHQGFSKTKQSIWVGVLSTGVPFMGAPFLTALCETYPKIKCRYYVIFGWAICVCSLVSAAFAKSLVALAWTQGAFYGAGLLIVDVPALLILNTWFVKHRGTAYGLLFGITDLIGFGETILAEYLLRKHTLRGALFTFASSLFVICGPSIWLLKSRTPDVPTPAAVREIEDVVPTSLVGIAPESLCSSVFTRYYRRPIFYIFTFANLFHSLAYYLPFMYLPAYTTSLGYDPTRGAYLLAAANFAQIFGEVGFGQLSDRVNVHCLILACSLGSSIATLGLWGFARSLVRLSWFALLYGTFGSGLISLWARMGTFFGQIDAQMIYSVMSFGRGLGVILSGAISPSLLSAASSRSDNESFKYGNGQYLGIVLFVGISMGVSALMGVIGLIWGWHQKELGPVQEKYKKTSSTSKV